MCYASLMFFSADYYIGPKLIRVCVSCYKAHRDAKVFLQAVEQSLLDSHGILENQQETKRTTSKY